jgi:phage gp29-like protein
MADPNAPALPSAEPTGEPAPKRRLPAQPERRVFKDMPITTWTGSWSTTSIQAALDAHDQGQMMMSAQLAESVQRDPRVITPLNTRAKGVVGLPVDISPADHPNAELARQAADEIRARWIACDWAVSLVGLLRTMILMGPAVAELVWSGDAERWHFDLRLWHPQFLWFNWADRSYQLNTQDGPVRVEPGDGKWLLLTPEGTYRAWMAGAIRSIAVPSLLRQLSKRDWARFCELYGLGILKAKVPSGAPETDKDRFFDSLVTRGSELVVQCPVGTDGQEYDVELVEAKATGWETFQAAIESADNDITLAILGQNLTTEVSGGSYAAATVHGQVRQDYLEADARVLAQAFMTQALRVWAQFNFGDPNLAPRVRWRTEPPEDRATEGDALGKLAAALVDLKTAAPADVNVRKLLARFNIPLLEAPAPGAAPPPSGPAEPPPSPR